MKFQLGELTTLGCCCSHRQKCFASSPFRPKIQKNVFADWKELLTVPSKQTSFIQTNPKTRLDIHTVSNCGVTPNKAIQTSYNAYRTKYSGTWSMYTGTLETMTSTETCKWMLCLEKYRRLHNSTKEDSTRMRTLRPYSSWTTWA
jgi:hypothetical protein